MGDDNQEVSKSRTYLYAAILIPSLITGFGSFYAGKNGQAALETQQLKNAYEQLNLTRKESDKYRAVIFEKESHIVDLLTRLQDKTDELGVLEALLDGLPFPAWIKQVNEKGKIEIVMINEAYTVHFGLTKSKARGKTNFDLFPHDEAQRYEKNDWLVIESQDYIKKVEPVSIKGVKKEILVYKFMIMLPEDITGIGGVSVHGLNEVCAASIKLEPKR